MSLLLLLVGAKTSGAGTSVQAYDYERFKREDQEILDLIMIIVKSGVLQ